MRHATHRGIALGAALALATAAVGLASAASPSPGIGPAVDDAYSVAEDTILTITAPGLLANDLAVPGSCVAAVDVSGLTGAVTVSPDGSFAYTPAADFNGATSFTYGLQLVGAEGCPGPYDGEATVHLTVTAVNDPPAAVADSFVALRGTTLNVGAPGVLGNDSDVDGDTLTAVKVSNPIHGVVVLAADGSLSYTPNPGYTGADAFSYRASDGAAFSAARVVSLQVTAVPERTPTPPPPPTPSPMPTAAPTATPEPSPSDNPEPTMSDEIGLPTPAVPTVSPSPTPSPSLASGPAAREGGLSTPAFLVLVLFAVLLVIGGAFGVSRWLDARRGGGTDPA
ncbi:MAG TPA: cadherin-like domain-containing protein [Candidatus Limnocylindrales bacterium]|nr:cadherin-like domain-containing protein [Candidatus Limnocylindrales bacterium]